MNWLKAIFHKHTFTENLIVSGYGLTEYNVWFCKYCPKVFGKQTKNFNNA